MPQRLISAIHEFTHAILNPYDPDDLLHRLILHTTETLPADGAGIMLEDEGGGLGFAAASGELVTQLELAQQSTLDGACYEAFKRDQLVVADDLRAEKRWPGYTERALELGLHSVLGVPLNAWGHTVGVLNVYRSRPGAWTAADIEACQLLAAMGAGYLLHATELQAQHHLTENLHKALASRGTIERAKGIIMNAEGLDADAAFRVLREVSMHRNQKLRDVALQIVEQGWHETVGRPEPNQPA